MAEDRTYFRVHDGVDEHPKIEPLSDAAFRLIVTTWAYCSRNRNDGRIADAVWRKRGKPKARQELERAGLVEQCDGHVQVHDYLDWQRSAAEIEEIKAGRGAGGAYGNHIRWHVKRRINDPGCEHCNPSQDRSDNRSVSDRKTIAQAETETDPYSREREDAAEVDARASDAHRLSLVPERGAPRQLPWCRSPNCDPTTRLRTDDHLDVVYRCPDCHPTAHQETA